MFRRFTFVACLSLSALIACNNSPSDIGSGFISTLPFNILYLDTVIVRTSTIIYDSVQTVAGGRFLVGHHLDEKLGPVTSSAVFQINAPSIRTLNHDNISYKAFTVHLLRDGYYNYDTTQEMTISAYRLTKGISINAGSLYNVDKFVVDESAPLGSFTFRPRPHQKDSVEIPLSDELGRELMDLFFNSDPVLNDFTDFEQFFHGIALVADPSANSCFLGFKPATSQVRLYYHDNSIYPPQIADKYIAFTIGANASSNGFYYNRIFSDRSSTKLASLNNNRQILNSSFTDHEIYIQGGVGIAARVEFPYLRNLLFIQPNFQVSRATLTFSPVLGYIQRLETLPTSLNVDLVDGNNVTLSPGYLRAFLSTDQFGNSSYSMDATAFVNGELATTILDHNGLILRLVDADYKSTVGRLTIGDMTNKFNMKLSLYYLTLIDQ